MAHTTAKFRHLLIASGFSLLMALPQASVAQEVEDRPTALEMTGDLVLARPVQFLTALGGTVAYVVSLPFSLGGGNAAEAGQTLVVDPWKATFVRCLGCTTTGYKRRDVEK